MGRGSQEARTNGVANKETCDRDRDRRSFYWERSAQEGYDSLRHRKPLPRIPEPQPSWWKYPLKAIEKVSDGSSSKLYEQIELNKRRKAEIDQLNSQIQTMRTSLAKSH